MFGFALKCWMGSLSKFIGTFTEATAVPDQIGAYAGRSHLELFPRLIEQLEIQVLLPCATLDHLQGGAKERTDLSGQPEHNA